MKRYAKYKDSGISWIGDVPEHWKECRFQYLFSERSEKNHPEEQVLCATQSHGVIPQSMYENRVVVVNKGFEGLKFVKKGDFVISLRSFQGGIEYAHYQGIISAAYTVLFISDKNLYSGYVRYLFKSAAFVDMLKLCVTGIREGQNINYDMLKKQFMPDPPPEEQKAIAEFLDNKTKQINELVSAKQKQIELLKEYKQAVIAKAVTQGINPKAKMKDSGISWIGQIPEHWECSTLRKHLQFVSEKGHPEELLLSVTREYGVIVRNTESKEENHNVIPEDLSNYKLVKKGQFAINKMKAWQGSYAVSSYTGIVSPAYYVCELNFEVKEFFSMAIRSKAYVPFFTMYSKGIRVDQWDLSPIGLKTIPLFIPPKDEQKRIVTFVNDKMVKIDSQIASVEKQIANLNEYKQSLISDVVTGKVKVV